MLNLGRLYMKQEKTNAAKEYFDTLIKKWPDNKIANLEMAKYYLHLNEKKLAKIYLDKAVDGQKACAMEYIHGRSYSQRCSTHLQIPDHSKSERR